MSKYTSRTKKTTSKTSNFPFIRNINLADTLLKIRKKPLHQLLKSLLPLPPKKNPLLPPLPSPPKNLPPYKSLPTVLSATAKVRHPSTHSHRSHSYRPRTSHKLHQLWQNHLRTRRWRCLRLLRLQHWKTQKASIRTSRSRSRTST